MSNCCSHGTLLHFSLQSSRLNICYYHQDLHQWRLHPGSRQRLRSHHRALLHVGPCRSARRLGMGTTLQRHPFSGLVDSAGELLHTPSDSDFHGHRPAVWINQHLSWDLMSVDSGTLTQHLVHPTSPVLLTKNGPLRAPAFNARLQLSKPSFLPI